MNAQNCHSENPDFSDFSFFFYEKLKKMAKNKTKKKRDLESLQRKRRTAMRDLNTGTEEEKLKKAEIRREQVKNF